MLSYLLLRARLAQGLFKVNDFLQIVEEKRINVRVGMNFLDTHSTGKGGFDIKNALDIGNAQFTRKFRQRKFIKWVVVQSRPSCF